MSVLRFADQNGNPVWGLATRIARGHGDTTKAEDERYPDKAGTTAFVGVKTVLPSPSLPEYPDPGHTIHVNYNEGLNPEWKAYTATSVYLADIEAIPSGYTVTVQKASSGGGSQITGNGTCDEWKKAVFAIFAKHGFTNCGPENAGQGVNQAPYLRATINEIKALHPSPFVQWQYSSTGDPKELRTRLFLPNDSGDQFARYADIGDWNKPIVWDHCQ